MIVCICSQVSDRDIAAHAHAGMSFGDIQLELGVATQCGCCEECARDIVRQCSAKPHVAMQCSEPAMAAPRAVLCPIPIHP